MGVREERGRTEALLGDSSVGRAGVHRGRSLLRADPSHPPPLAPSRGVFLEAALNALESFSLRLPESQNREERQGVHPAPSSPPRPRLSVCKGEPRGRESIPSHTSFRIPR